jgi:enoyl-CoA hydratase/carnithine racemase
VPEQVCPGITYETEGVVALVRLDRPERLNAFTYEMIMGIRTAVTRAVADEGVVGIVVTGVGRAFSAGLDMGDLGRTTQAGSSATQPNRDENPALFSFLLKAPKPVIAAVNGVTAGGGFVLAMMSDLRFGSPEASFTTAFSKRALVAEHGTSWILPRIVGTSRALDLLWSARRVDAEEAYRIGFLDRLVPAAELLATACGYLEDLAASVAPRSVATMKQQVYDGLSATMIDNSWSTFDVQEASLSHPDAAEGVASFLERRPPKFARWSEGS